MKTLKERIAELCEYHEKQAAHYEPFGENNVLTVFHRAAVVTLKDAEIIRQYIENMELE